MLTYLKQAAGDLLHLFYPHICAGCGDHLPSSDQHLCLDCLLELPETNFQHITGNPVEKVFYGRIKIQSAFASYYFSKNSPLQHIIHAFKYQHNKEVCHQMGVLMGQHIKSSSIINNIDLIIPMPIHADREKKRGYNQAAVLAEGISAVTGIPFRTDLVIRNISTATQTHKGRGERWKNVQSVFEITDHQSVQNRHVLLADDVITTGATVEACGEGILKAQPASLSIAALAWASE
jgi:ComF family protein